MRIRIEREIDLGDSFRLQVKGLSTPKAFVVQRLLEKYTTAEIDDVEDISKRLISLLEETVISWNGLTAKMLRERYGITVEHDDGRPFADDEEIPFDKSLLTALLLNSIVFATDLMLALSRRLKTTVSETERIEKNS